ncbi:relaxase/mobilization nuclease domain-containing protein [Erythrobacter sp. SN021]|uniref:relaxase/mobilization nuclease domain-containing protein n=1 Tax=Erythrobacter sp. SN021 TaxID=2912574 RepID=UPI001F214D57|nr:relaxase/mobilization nuclease domain-containing protein [Erythrobacter sp. SN021]MCF8883431.1 relaxase/mobilization nuclease domain-containing protein [Erythrobacter sp. SN021]
MTIYHKCKSREAARATDISRLRGKTSALIHYVWRADLRALARASMETAINSYHEDLLRYVQRDEHHEEVAATLVRNVLTDNPNLMTGEMAALMEEADAGDGVVEHVIVSVQQGDDLLGNFEEAVEILVEALGVGNCPVIGAVHADTDHMHFHLVIIRVDVDTGEVVDLPQYDQIRGQQALAVMEHRFGWKREENSRWEVVEGRLVLDGTADHGPADNPREWPDRYFPPAGLSAQGRRQEKTSGYVSAERRIRDIVPGLIANNSDRASFLAELAKEGIELVKAHRGAAYVVHMEDERGRHRREQVKASVIRGWGAKALERRYGPIGAGDGPAIQSKKTRPKGGNPEWPRYTLAKSQYRERLNAMSQNVRAALPGVVSAREALSAARSACVFPTFEEWQSGARPPDIGAALFAHCGARVLERGSSGSRSHAVPVPDKIFIASGAGGKVIYTGRGTIGGPRIVDFGDKVVLTGRTRDEEIRKALQLLSIRGAHVVSGSGFSRREMARAQKIGNDLDIVVFPQREIFQIPAVHVETQEPPARGPAKDGKAVVTQHGVQTALEQQFNHDLNRC